MDEGNNVMDKVINLIAQRELLNGEASEEPCQ